VKGNKAGKRGKNKSHRMTHMVNIRKANSELNVEILPDDPYSNLVLLLDYERIPTHKQFKFGTMVKELPRSPRGGTCHCLIFKHYKP
jgi:hypothetical protein